MRKIELKNYMLTVPTADGTTEKPYDVKGSLVNCLLHPALELTGHELLLRGKLATQIEEGNGHILVEESDYRKLRQAMEKIKGFAKNDMELVRRVLEAEETEVEEKTKGQKVKGKRR